MNIRFSLIICTNNPDHRLLNRCLNATFSQKLEGFQYEIILVDNNSAPSLHDYLDLNPQLKFSNNFKIITEARQGLAFARITGVKNSRGSIIVFVDDDNELSIDYLINLNRLISEYPSVGVWGAGFIDVEFVDDAPAWVIEHFKSIFQFRKMLYTEFGCAVGWPDYYPVGSGMIVKKEIFFEYIKLFETGVITATDRKGNNLSSAGDSQIVWTSIKRGVPAGTSPQLKLNHLIPNKRISLQYLSNLNYNISHSYYLAIFEMFPLVRSNYSKHGIGFKIGFLLKQLLKAKFKPLLFYKIYKINNSWNKGYNKALSVAVSLVG